MAKFITYMLGILAAITGVMLLIIWGVFRHYGGFYTSAKMYETTWRMTLPKLQEEYSAGNANMLGGGNLYTVFTLEERADDFLVSLSAKKNPELEKTVLSILSGNSSYGYTFDVERSHQPDFSQKYYWKILTDYQLSNPEQRRSNSPVTSKKLYIIYTNQKLYFLQISM